jgi:hypothetical protein
VVFVSTGHTFSAPVTCASVVFGTAASHCSGTSQFTYFPCFSYH